jgi:membrane carboxypeptidase/penicillin-binding protein PbpC
MRLVLKIILISFLFSFLSFLFFLWHLEKNLLTIYYRLESKRIFDRQGREIAILPNGKGNFARYLDEIPPSFEKLLIEKEDKYFYWHFGINPISSFRAALGYFNLAPKRASSTITQQLVKILLGKEFERNLKNKIIEAFYTLALETFQSKKEILKMYLNSIYLGNQSQGIEQASQVYFGLSPDLLTQGQILQILATISSPSERNPAKEINQKLALSLAQKLNLKENLLITDSQTVRENLKRFSAFSNSYFEVKDLIKADGKAHQLTIDLELNQKVREILKRNLEELKGKRAKNGAVIVILLPENEVLALVGSADPSSFENGNQINMLFKPRAIGSTIKPFIYLRAFEKGLRPYSLVEDREYRYLSGRGFSFYPRNFDLQYRGKVNLHYALANSLNVPTLKVLEYLGLEDFSYFMEKDLGFKPIQPWENYQLDIALGGLEMSLWDLARFFTIFPNQGVLRELKIEKNQSLLPTKIVSQPEYIQLVNKILNDRKTSIDQFGLKSDLNLGQENYCLKTGTSRDFLDSWIVGFTPDFLVGVWIGNADNSPMDALSGQIGAGRIWSEIMDLLFNSKYNRKTPLSFDLITQYPQGDQIEYGLAGDDFQKTLNLLLVKNEELILNPHQGDKFLFEEGTKIILKARENVEWFINDQFLGQGEEIVFSPQKPGNYQIRAKNASQEEKINISLTRKVLN